jgi:hypothetical protein
MSFLQIKNVGLAMWLWSAIVAIVSFAQCESVVNKQMSIWQNKKGALAGFLLYAIIVIVLIIVLIVVLRYLFNII